MDSGDFRDGLNNLLPLVLVTLAAAGAFQFVFSPEGRASRFVGYLFYAGSAFFLARLVVEYRASEDMEEFLRSHWLDFLLVVPAFSAVKELRLIKVVQELSVGEELFLGVSSVRSFGPATRVAKLARMVKRSLDL